MTDQTIRTQVAPNPRENIEAASYLTRTPWGVPIVVENSKSAGKPNIQISKIDAGTIIVVKISTAISQYLSRGKRPGFANLYDMNDKTGRDVTIDNSMIELQRIWIQSKGPKMARFSLFGPAGKGDSINQSEITRSAINDQIMHSNRNKKTDFLANECSSTKCLG